MIIDCGTCAVRDLACGDCVVSVLLGPPGVADGAGEAVAVPVRSGTVAGGSGPSGGGPVELDAPELAALQALAGSGLVPPLRLVPPPPAPKGRAGPGSGRAATA